MGKRSNFERVERDFYRTPTDAVEPLRPFIQDVQSFCEPCAGDGALINALVDMGLRCTSAFDIQPQSINIEKQDALALDERDLLGADLIITNPPWNRDILHPMIEYFTDLGTPTWLLFDADWIHTNKQYPTCHASERLSALAASSGSTTRVAKTMRVGTSSINLTQP